MFKNHGFFWKLESSQQGQLQTANQLIEATSKENLDKNLGDAFDSKKVKTSQTTQIVYSGKSLKPASEYYWKLKVWDKENKESKWSETAHFSTGLLSVDDWKGAQ